MEKNIGTIDQMIRVAGLIGSAIFYFIYSPGIPANIAGVFGIYCFMTALTGYSPIWELLGISTLKLEPLADER